MDQSLDALFSRKSVWTYGPESLKQVSAGTDIGPWMALPSFNHKIRTPTPESRKGVGGHPRWREEVLPLPEIDTSFLHPFSRSPS